MGENVPRRIGMRIASLPDHFTSQGRQEISTMSAIHTKTHRQDPSPQEIRRRCQEFQKGWSFDERLRRAGIRLGQGITFVPPESRLLAALAGYAMGGRAA
jgi:hypothetical protein